MSGMKVLPRYRTWETGVGCAAHGDPTCLCDVVIGEPAPIIKTEHKFHNIALNELGDDVVSERNLHEFFTIVLGLFELESHLAGADRAITRWGQLPRPVATALHHHAKADSPWTIAMIELEDIEMTPAQLKKLRHEYVQVAAVLRCRKRTGRPITERERASAAEALERKRERDRLKKAAKRADPEVRAKRSTQRREARATLGKAGKSWREAKHAGPTYVPGTYALEDKEDQ
jgi:hypothetical protein